MSKKIKWLHNSKFVTISRKAYLTDFAVCDSLGNVELKEKHSGKKTLRVGTELCQEHKTLHRIQ